jgi:hypothetical protein
VACFGVAQDPSISGDRDGRQRARSRNEQAISAIAMERLGEERTRDRCSDAEWRQTDPGKLRKRSNQASGSRSRRIRPLRTSNPIRRDQDRAEGRRIIHDSNAFSGHRRTSIEPKQRVSIEQNLQR